MTMYLYTVLIVLQSTVLFANVASVNTTPALPQPNVHLPAQIEPNEL